MRVFIAIDFEEVKDYFQRLQKEIDQEGIRFTFPKVFHLTLQFLGEKSEEEVEEIKEKLKQVSFSPYETTVDGLGIFSHEHLIRVVWIGLQDEETKQLQKKIHVAVGGKQEKDFVPHITLARVKQIPNEIKKELVEKIKTIKATPKQVKVEKFFLIASVLGPEGPRYEVLAEYQ